MKREDLVACQTVQMSVTLYVPSGRRSVWTQCVGLDCLAHSALDSILTQLKTLYSLTTYLPDSNIKVIVWWCLISFCSHSMDNVGQFLQLQFAQSAFCTICPLVCAIYIKSCYENTGTEHGQWPQVDTRYDMRKAIILSDNCRLSCQPNAAQSAARPHARRSSGWRWWTTVVRIRTQLEPGRLACPYTSSGLASFQNRERIVWWRCL